MRATKNDVVQSLGELAPGLFVSTSVRLVRPYVRGGMATLWVGEHLGLETQVAVKFIDPQALADEPNLEERFKREAKITAALRSPHVVQVFDHGAMHDATPFMVMELLDGEDLRSRLRRKRLERREATLLVTQVAEVLVRAHSLGVVHRDLKPSNLFLLRSGYQLFTKVLDFGVAKRRRAWEQRVTSTGIVIGTPSYMSPEMIESAKDADDAADLWALAVVAYESLLHIKPFHGSSMGALFTAICAGELVPPSSLRPELGRGADRFFEKALAHDQRDRFDNAQELAAAFAAAMDVTLGSPLCPTSSATTMPGGTPFHQSCATPVAIDLAKTTKPSVAALPEAPEAATLLRCAPKEQRPAAPQSPPASAERALVTAVTTLALVTGLATAGLLSAGDDLPAWRGEAIVLRSLPTLVIATREPEEAEQLELQLGTQQAAPPPMDPPAPAPPARPRAEPTAPAVTPAVTASEPKTPAERCFYVKDGKFHFRAELRDCHKKKRRSQ